MRLGIYIAGVRSNAQKRKNDPSAQSVRRGFTTHDNRIADVATSECDCGVRYAYRGHTSDFSMHHRQLDKIGFESCASVSAKALILRCTIRTCKRLTMAL
jgi:hypothetical protein